LSRSYCPDQKNQDTSNEARKSGFEKIAGSISIQSASDGRPCPFLGCREWATSPQTRPSRDNVCFGRPRTRRKGFRKVQSLYSSISREKQADTCLKSFVDCSYYQTASSKNFEKNESKKSVPGLGVGRPAQKTASKTSGINTKRKRKRSGTQNKSSRPLLPKRWRSAIQMGAVFMICAMAALGLSLFLSTNPSSFVDYIFTTIVRNDIKAFGLKYRGLKDKSTVGGLVPGGNIRSVKSLSKTDKA
jgi:hypothetical protein